jgi:hypothetical protein
MIDDPVALLHLYAIRTDDQLPPLEKTENEQGNAGKAAQDKETADCGTEPRNVEAVEVNVSPPSPQQTDSDRGNDENQDEAEYEHLEQ